MKKKTIFPLLLVCLFLPGAIQASDDQETYSLAVENARDGNKDLVF